MDKHASEPSVSARAARRPLTEFIASPALSAVVELPRAKKPVELHTEPDGSPQTTETSTASDQPQVETANEGAVHPEQSQQEQSHRVAENPRHGWLGAVAAINALAAKATADYRAWVTEHMKNAVGCAFGYACGLVSLNLPADQRPADISPPAQRGAAITGAAEDFADAAAACTRAFEAMSAYWAAGLDYTRRLADASSPADLILLSTSQARQQVDLLMEQAAALNALSRSIIAAHTKS